jgi:hypothetical protein
MVGRVTPAAIDTMSFSPLLRVSRASFRTAVTYCGFTAIKMMSASDTTW